MKLLTEAEYNSRVAELTEEKGLAEQDYRRAALALEVGSGDEEAVAKAQQHVDRIAGRIEGLHGAWEVSKRLAAQQRAEDADDAHADLAAEVDVELTKRLKAFIAIMRHAAALSKAMQAFDEAVPTIRRMLGGRMASMHGSPVFANSLQAGQVVGAVLSENGCRPELIGPSQQSSEQQLAREEKLGDAVRSKVASLAPDKTASTKVAADPMTPPAGMYDYAANVSKGVPSGFDPVSGES